MSRYTSHDIRSCFYYEQLIPAVGIALNSANVIGYFKCRKDAGTKLRNMAGQFIGQQLLKQVCGTCLI